MKISQMGVAGSLLIGGCSDYNLNPVQDPYGCAERLFVEDESIENQRAATMERLGVDESGNMSVTFNLSTNEEDLVALWGDVTLGGDALILAESVVPLREEVEFADQSFDMEQGQGVSTFSTGDFLVETSYSNLDFDLAVVDGRCNALLMLAECNYQARTGGDELYECDHL